MKTLARLTLLLLAAASVQAQISNQQALSQVGATLARSTCEISGGVTPSNYGYPPGNVLRYGADATGVADSATAITRAIAALCSANGGVVYFPKGIYKVTSVTITRQATVYGDGIGSTQIYAGDASSDVFVVPAGVSSVTFRDFTMSASVTRTNGRYFYAKVGSSIVNFTNLYLLNWFYGIDLEGTNYTIRDVTMVNGIATTGEGVRIGFDASPGTLSDIAIETLKIDNAAGAKPFACVAVAAAGDVSLINSQLQHCGHGLDLVPAGTSVIASVYSVNSFFDNSGSYGVFAQPQAAGAAIVRTRLIGPWASSAGTNGMLIDTSAHAGSIDGFDIIGAHVLLNSAQGISIAGANTKRVKIAESEIAGNIGAGVLVNAGVTDFQIQNSTIGPTGAVGGNTTFGVVIQAGASTEYIVTGNDLCGNTNGPMTDAGSGTIKVITGNACFNPVANTSIANTAVSPVTWTNNTGFPAYVSVTGTPVITTITMGGGAQIGNATGTAYLVPQGLTITVNFSSGTANVTYWGVN